MTTYPTLRRAAAEIAYDNGMVNRFASEANVLDAMVASAVASFTPAELAEVEAQLAAMTEDALCEFCTGGTDGPRTSLADRVLDHMFEPE